MNIQSIDKYITSQESLIHDAHVSRFILLVCGLVPSGFTPFLQGYCNDLGWCDCLSASEATLYDVGKSISIYGV